MSQRDGTYEVNLRNYAPGAQVGLVDGRVMEVVENPGDGAWLICREAGTQDAPELVYLSDVAGESD